MGRAKDIICKVIPSSVANPFVKSHHYSGKIVNNSQLHIGAFLDGKLHGVLSFGPSMDKSKIQPLVKGTGWNEFIELNRMAFDEVLPKNAESRCIAQAVRMIKKNAPQIKWIVSFADGTQCGDGTIYRASGFYLTGITKNKTILKFPTGDVMAAMTLETNFPASVKGLCEKMGVPVVYRTRNEWVKLGAEFIDGYMLRYIYFIDKTAKDRLTVPILPFSEIDRLGARTYKGVHYSNQCAGSGSGNTPSNQLGEGGSKPTPAHHSKGASE